MPQEPDKTIHGDLGLTAAMDFSGPIDESLRGDPADVGIEEVASFEMSEKLWTLRRVCIATLIVAAAAGELAWALSSRDSLAARRETAARLPESEKADLEDKHERFNKLDPAEQTRIRELQAELARDPSPESLHATMEKYLKWKARLSPQESAMLAGLKPEERAARVAAVRAEERAADERRFDELDSKKLIGWLEYQVRTHQANILAGFPSAMRERFEMMGDHERTMALIYHLVSTRGSGARLEMFVNELPKLRAQLSPAAQLRWDAATKNPNELKLLLSDWIRQSFERAAVVRNPSKPNFTITEKDLKNHFERMPEDERQRLMALPSDEGMSHLRRDYLRSKGLIKDHGGNHGPFGRGPFGGPDDGRGGEGRGGFRRPPDGDHQVRPDGPKPGERRSGGEVPPPPPPRPFEGEFRPDGFRGGDRDKNSQPDRKPVPDAEKIPNLEKKQESERRNEA
jgi:hypothetical protein